MIVGADVIRDTNDINISKTTLAGTSARIPFVLYRCLPLGGDLGGGFQFRPPKMDPKKVRKNLGICLQISSAGSSGDMISSYASNASKPNNAKVYLEVNWYPSRYSRKMVLTSRPDVRSTRDAFA